MKILHGLLQAIVNLVNGFKVALGGDVQRRSTRPRPAARDVYEREFERELHDPDTDGDASR